MFKKICLLVFILSSVAFSDTLISGEMYGTLSQENSPYFISDTVTVPAGKRLTIEPGVTVKFRPDTREREGAIMIIFGDLKAIGTVDDSIYFTKSEGSGYWQSILIREDAENCVFEYCHFTYGSGSIVGSYFSEAAIYCFESSATVKYCDFTKNVEGVSIGGSGAIVKHCRFFDNQDAGASVNSSSGRIENCLFYNNDDGIYFSGRDALLKNCTVTNNNTGVIFNSSSKAPAVNCIIWDNNKNVWDRNVDWTGETAQITYSTIQGGWHGTGNIELDPLFVNADSGDFHLQILSPCIDGGDPSHSCSLEPDYNGDIINMGTYGNTVEATTSFRNQPEISIAYPTLDFGLVSIGTQDSLEVNIKNIGNDSLLISYLAFENPDVLFSYIMPNMSIAPKQSSKLKIYLNAYKDGDYEAKLFIANNDTTESISFIKIKVEITSGLYGNISGILEKENSPYLVGGDVTVPINKTLIIEPGVRIEVVEDASIYVYGTLYCNGSEEDSIVMTSQIPGQYWGSLYFGPGSGDSEVSYSIIEQGEGKGERTDGFWGTLSSFISCNLSGPWFHHNLIKPADNIGGLTVYMADTDITDNIVIGGYFGGIRSSNNNSNIIRNIVMNNRCHGLDIDNGGTPHVENNILINNYNGMYASDTEFDFVNNTIIGSSHAGLYLWNLDEKQPNVKNCIIWDCATSIMPYGLENGYLPTVSYSNIQGGWEGEGNIDTIPYFVDPATDNYRLSDSSACIDAGDPDPRYNDIDSTRNDMGTSGGRNGYYLSTPIIYTGIIEPIIPNGITLLNNYPNPFNPSTTIQFHVTGSGYSPVSLKIYSSNGKLVKTLKSSVNGTGDYQIIWDSTSKNGTSVPSGLYIYTLQIDDKIQSGKMTLLK